MTTLVLEEPKVEILEDGTQKISDSFGKLLELKAIHGNKFTIEELDHCGCNIHPKYWGKTRDDNGKPVVIPGHEGYHCYPFVKAVMKENKNGELEWFGNNEFICIIPRGLKKTLKPGRYILDEWKNAVPSLAKHAKNLDAENVYYVAQNMGGMGDPEYNFISSLIEMFEETLDYFDEIAWIPGIEEILPLCVKRVGYLKL